MVYKVAIEAALNAAAVGSRLVRVSLAEVGAHHLAAVTHYVVQNHKSHIGEDIQHSEGQSS